MPSIVRALKRSARLLVGFAAAASVAGFLFVPTQTGCSGGEEECAAVGKSCLNEKCCGDLLYERTFSYDDFGQQHEDTCTCVAEHIGGGGSITGGGVGGTSAGSAGSAGSGGSAGGGQVVTDCPGVVPAAALITDFATPPVAGGKFEWGSAAKGTDDFWGGTFNYPEALMLGFEDGAMTAAGNITEYAGFGLYVQNCADASSFEGIRFKISGNPPMGKLRFALQTNRNEWATGVKGSCLAADAKKFVDCVHPSVEIPVTGIPTTVDVKWANLAAGKPASAASTTGSDVIGLQWILPWAEMGSTPYDVSVTIDDVAWIGEATGAGGSGAGGAGSGSGGAP
jgi:hypothetical protein